MDNHTIGWIVLIFILFLTTFGVYWCLILVTSILIFILGLMSLLYIQEGNVDKFYRHCAGNPLLGDNICDGGLSEVAKKLSNPKKQHKYDNRVTGSDLIDSSLQEILGYIIRDYIIPWYSLISKDNEFPQKTIKRTAQSLAINISNRVKDVDWIPFLTTKLVDDATTHLKLFKQARIKMKHEEASKSPRNSPRKEIRASPKKMHKRNKSETDVNWYFGNRNVVECRDVEHNMGNNKFYSKDSKKVSTLEDYFFDLECAMDKNNVCHDLICIEIDQEKEFLSELVEILLYILLPDEDFQCKPLRYIVREILVNCIVFPVFTMISDPDYINQAVIWLCLRDVPLPSETFLTALRLTDNCDELKYTKEMVVKEIQVLRSRDSGGESDLSIKQQLSSLMYVLKLIDSRLSKINNLDAVDTLCVSDYTIPLESLKTVDLPLNVILVNNVALSYFIDYVSSHGIHACLFFYLNVEGWKISVEQQISDMQINKIKGLNENASAVYENIRSTATNLYDQYLGDKREQKIDINAALVHKLYFKIKNLSETPSELWFDDIQTALLDKLENGEEYLPMFKQSHIYLRLLEELDLLQQQTEEDAISLNSIESGEDEIVKTKEINQNVTSISTKTLKPMTGENFLHIEPPEKNLKHVRSLSDVTDFSRKYDIMENTKNLNVFKKMQNNGCVIEKTVEKEKDLKTGDFTLAVEIIQTGIISEKGKTFGAYAMHVSRQYVTGYLEEWHIYRRYSDFYDLHNKVKDRFPDLSKLTFPGKKTFHNTDRAVLERRMRMLGIYMHTLCKDSIINTHGGLKELLMTFLEQGEYDRANSGGPISHTIDTLVNPLKSGMKTIKNMPEQIINTVDEVVEGLNKVFHTKQSTKALEASKIGTSIDPESDDNIPLRIMLVLMDEVFDLKSKNQWLRRRIVTLLRQILRTMFGDIVNRRILDYVSFITSPKNVAHYLHVFKQSFWPNGVKAEKKPDRDEAVKFRTRIAAKIALLSCQTDELKHIIGSETTRKGLMTIFEIFQKPILNRRLLYVLLEDILSTLFPEKNVSEIFLKLYSKSKRYQEKQKHINTQKVR